MLKKKLTALLLAVSMTIAVLPITAWADTRYATRQEVCDMLLAAADDYTPGLERDDIVKGYPDGQTRDDQPITRAESFVMISRAFGTLPEPVGNDLRVAPAQAEFRDMPDWARQDIENLTNARVVIGTDDQTLSPDENVTTEQVTTIISRIWALFGSNVRDDFYATQNKQWLDNSTIPTGEMASGSFNDLSTKNTNKITGIIETIVASEQKKGTKEQKIKDFYETALAVGQRQVSGIEPLEGYLKAIGEAKSIDELYALSKKIKDETGVGTLMAFMMNVDLKDSNSYIMNYSGLSPALTKEMYQSEEKSELYLDYIMDILHLGGDDWDSAEEGAKQYYDMEKDIVLHSLEQQDYNNVDKVYNLYTVEELQKEFPHFDITRKIKDDEFKLPDKIVVGDVGAMQTYSKYFTPEKLDTLKASMKLSVLSNLGTTLDYQFIDKNNEFSNKLFGMEGNYSPKELASSQTQSVMQDYLGQAYVETYFSPEAKADVEDMISQFISIYKDRIHSLDWMSDETKKMAVKKLDTMQVKVGYPDSWDSGMDSVEVKGISEGGSLYGNVCELLKRSWKGNVALQGTKVEKSGWMMPAYEVNAYYNASANEIVFPAGILQAPFYDVNASRETNLGGVGTIIAHEITHAFDNNGAKFDEKGNAANWWTEEDYAKFQALCEKTVGFYDGQEVAPGIVTNGMLTLGENIADIGGVACALQAVGKLENPNYREFFDNYARIWAMTYTREALEMRSTLDSHSANKVRANRAIVNFDEFYQTFGVKPGDGMYVPESERIHIW